MIIYAETQREWMLAAQAAFSQSLQVVTVYATLGEEGLIHGTTQTKSKVIVADAKLLKIVANAIKTNKAGMKSCTSVVYIEDPVQKPDPIAAAALDAALDSLKKAGIKVVTFDELQASGEAAPLAVAPPKAEDVAVIMYTSGTTGMPKARRRAQKKSRQPCRHPRLDLAWVWRRGRSPGRAGREGGAGGERRPHVFSVGRGRSLPPFSERRA